MNYHLMIDDKFIDDFITDNELQGSINNIFIIEGVRENMKFVKHPSISFVLSLPEYLFKLKNSLINTDKIFIHWLHEGIIDFILTLNKKIKVGLFFWGGDIVEDPEELYRKFNLESLTLNFYNNNYLKKPVYFRIYKNPINILRNYKNYISFHKPILDRLARKNEVLKRLDYFLHWNQLDYTWIKKRVKGFNAEFIPHCYGLGLDKELPELEIRKKDSIVFWLGNSATLANNHLDALKVLGRYKKEDIKILCPLSYGEAVEGPYIQEVIKYGKELFGTKFVSLCDYMPRKEYYKLFREVDIVVMWHNRTQAAGNVAAFLKMGKQVYMQPKSTLYKLFKLKYLPVSPTSFLEKLDFQELKKANHTYNFTKIHAITLDEIFLNQTEKVALLQFLNNA